MSDVRAYNDLRSFSTTSIDLLGVVTETRAAGADTGIVMDIPGLAVGDVVTIKDTGTKYDLAFEVNAVETGPAVFVIDTAFAATTFAAGTVSVAVKPIFVENALEADFALVFTPTIPSSKSDVTEFIGSRHFHGLKWALPAITAVESGDLYGIQHVLSSAIDLTNSAVSIRYYTDRTFYSNGATNYHQRFTLQLGSSAGIGSNALEIDLPLAVGWHEINIPISAFEENGTPVITAIDGIGFIYKSNADDDQAVFNIYLEEITVTPTGSTKGAFMFGFDDSYKEGHRDIAAPKLASVGFRSMLYAEGNTIGTGTGSGERMSLAELSECRNLGMLLCSHWSGAYFMPPGSSTPETDKTTVATETRIRQWCEGIKAWMTDNGFTEGMDYLAMPGGTGYIQSLNHLDIILEYFEHVRFTTPWYSMGPYTTIAATALNTSPQTKFGERTSPLVRSDPRIGDATQIAAGASFDTDMKAFVDACVDKGDLGVLFIHNIETGGDLTDNATAGYDMNQTQFNALVDYVKTKVDANTLDVITYQDLVEVSVAADIVKDYRGRYN